MPRVEYPKKTKSKSKKASKPRKPTSKRLILLTAALLIVAGASYYPGLGTINDMVVRSRCAAGAFMTDAQPPVSLESDSQDARTDLSGAVVQDTASAFIKPVKTLSANLIPNPGAEAMSQGEPSSWSTSRWGENTTTFNTFPSTGSRRALRVNMTAHDEGAAYWYPGPIAVSPGKYYSFSDSYRSSVPTVVTLAIKTDQGRNHYYTAGRAPAAADWTSFTTRFFVPANVREVQIYHSLDRVGWLDTDSYSLTQAEPTGFNNGMVSVTFDDGWDSIHGNALPIMKRHGVVSTQYLLSGYLGKKSYMKPGDVYDFVDAGHEVASHTIDHARLTETDDKELKRQLTDSAKGLQKCYGQSASFASPYGAYDTRTTSQVKSIYRTHRTTDTGTNSADYLNPYELKAQNIYYNTTQEQIDAWLKTAKANRAWLILVYHQVDDSRLEHSRSPADFEKDMKQVAASGLKNRTVDGAYTIAEAAVKH